MKLEGSEERKLWSETVVSLLKGAVTEMSTSEKVQADAKELADAAIAVADNVALALRARDTSRPR